MTRPTLELAWRYPDDLLYMPFLPSASILERLMYLLLSDNIPINTLGTSFSFAYPLYQQRASLTQIHTADLNPLSLLLVILTSMSVCASIWFTWHHTACLTQTIPPNSLTSHHHFLPLFPSWHHRLNCDFLFTSSQDAVHCDMLPIATTFSKYLPSQAFQHDGQ
jgi:hypothetical protein